MDKRSSLNTGKWLNKVWKKEMFLKQPLRISSGVTVFCHLSNSKTETCGFFEDPSDSNYGASPDALAASPFILELSQNKTS